MGERTLAVTIDIEADHGWTRPYRFDALSRTAALQGLCDRLDVPLTAFATGEALEHDSPLWAWLDARGDEIGLHSYAHPRPGQPWDRDDLLRACDRYQARFARAAGCWRPPYGRLQDDALLDLRDAGLDRLSTYRRRGGLLAAPDGGAPLLDKPVSRVFGLPLTLSQLLTVGPVLLRGLPDRAVLCLHLHDVVPTDARAALPWFWRAAYRPGRRHGDPLVFFEGLLAGLARQGVRFVPLFGPLPR